MAANRQLRAARERTPSTFAPGDCMGRAELADAVCAWLWETTGRRYELDGHYLARLERGVVRWPNAAYRAGLRHVLGVAKDSDLGFVPIRRGAKVALNGADTGTEPDESRPAVKPSQIDPVPADPNAFLAMSQAFQAADRQLGGGTLYGQVIRYISAEVGPRLLVPQAETASGDLFSAAASLTEIAGWMAHDAGDDVRARDHFDHAFRLASAADNAALIANTCASMSHLAGQLGESASALRIADEGLARVGTAPGTAQLAARLHTMRARGLAMRGERRECGQALAEAERTLSRVTTEAATP